MIVQADITLANDAGLDSWLDHLTKEFRSALSSALIKVRAGADSLNADAIFAAIWHAGIPCEFYVDPAGKSHVRCLFCAVVEVKDNQIHVLCRHGLLGRTRELLGGKING